jgi:demethylspheroidene O-methyltransferase
MRTHMEESPVLPVKEHGSRWREELERRVDRWMTSPALHRWAAEWPLTRWLVKRRAGRLFEVMAGFVHSQVLLACVRLRLLDMVHRTPRTREELAHLTGLPASGLDRLLDSAVSLGLLEHRSGNRMGLGPLGAPVVTHAGIRDMVEHNATLYHDLTDPLALLRNPSGTRMNRLWPYAQDAQASASQVGDTTSSTDAHGHSFAHYSGLMGSSQRFVIEELLSAYPFTDHRHVLDVGGGLGGWVSALARAQPRLALSLFDLPPVAALATESLTQAGLAHRVHVHGGSFIADELPVGADLITLLRVAHDHDDATVLRLLGAIHRCLPLGGSLLIAEPMAGMPGERSVTDPYYHFYLTAMGPGRLRTPAELAALMQNAGFTHIEEVPGRQPMHARLLVGRKTRTALPIHPTGETVNFD